MDVKVGDTFWFVGTNNRHTQEQVTVTKVGRKWCTLSNRHRFDRTDKCWRMVDGGNYSSPGRLYDSEKQFQEQLEFSKVIDAIHRKTGSYSWGWSNTTLADVRKAAELLGIELSSGSETPR